MRLFRGGLGKGLDGGFQTFFACSQLSDTSFRCEKLFYHARLEHVLPSALRQVPLFVLFGHCLWALTCLGECEARIEIVNSDSMCTRSPLIGRSLFLDYG